MRKLTGMLLGLSLCLLGAGATLAESKADSTDEKSQAEADCRQYALEDKIPQNQVEIYVADCTLETLAIPQDEISGGEYMPDGESELRTNQENPDAG